MRRTGCASLDLCAVAAGWLDGFYEHGLQPWDVAAGAFMVRLGGGRYLGCDAGRVDEDPRTAYRHRAYWATASDVEHPTLRAVVTGLAATGSPLAGT